MKEEHKNRFVISRKCNVRLCLVDDDDYCEKNDKKIFEFVWKT